MNVESRAAKSGDDPVAKPGTALVRVPPAATGFKARVPLQQGLWAAGFVVVLGVAGYGIGMAGSSSFWARHFGDAPVQPDATAQLLRKLGDEVARLKGSVETMKVAADAKQDETLRGLRKSVDTLKQEIEQVRSADAATLAQFSAKLDKADHDPTQKLADIAARLDRLDRDPAPKGTDTSAPKLAELNGRLDRLEKQVSAQVPTGSIPPVVRPAAPVAAAVPVPLPVPARVAAVPTPTAKPLPKPEVASKEASLVPATPEKVQPAKPPTLDGWVLRDVYDGIALVEARRGDLREITPGEFLPGAGEVRSIERHGKAWVVLTSRGVIENSTF